MRPSRSPAGSPRRKPSSPAASCPAAEGVARAIALARTASRPVVLADTQDNPGGGGHGDTTGLLAELIRQDAQGAVLGLINDAESAAACHAAGEGATLPLSLGGRSDGAPLAVTATVEAPERRPLHLHRPDGARQPRRSRPLSAAPRLARRARHRGVAQDAGLDQALFTHLGVQPAEQKILALKSSVHFRADFQPIASEVIVVAAPGPVVADPAVLPFTRLRPSLRLRPGANR